MIPPLPRKESSRPMSDISTFSELSTITGCSSIATRQSVNEILSLADGASVYSLDSTHLDDIEVSEVGLDIKEEPCDFANLRLKQSLANPVLDIMGSMTSVSTVKERQSIQPMEEPSSSTPLPEEAPSSSTPLAMDCSELDLGQIYDDVMQCVYDDVDTKYDNIMALVDSQETGEPPIPPLRRRGLSVDEGLLKPLPGVPKNPSLLHKLAEKKEEIAKEREKEKEKKKLLDEQRRKEKEIQEELRRKEREERENEKRKERDIKRQEEEQKKLLKKKEEEEKKLKKLAELEGENKMKQSLFQRLFQRSQSRGGEVQPEEADSTENVEVPPPVPPHGASVAMQSDDVTPAHNNDTTDLDIQTEISQLEQFIVSGNLDHLDSMVTEFAKQCLPEANTQSEQSSQLPAPISQL
jgi:hypothetical protein